jgi:hypothetical protein
MSKMKSVRLSSIPAKTPKGNKVGVQQTIDGLPVKNMTKPIKLTITAADCKRGKSKLPNSCAAALAAARQVPNCAEARIHLNRAYLRIGKVWWRGKIPNALRTEIAAFDKGGEFSPGEYMVMPLSPSERPDGKRMGSEEHAIVHGNRGKAKNKARPHHLVGVRESAREEYRHK